MSLYPDERASDLPEAFFDSAQDLVHALNEGGLELEKNPEDKEVVRNLGRIVHTLKGDAAACGFQELSELAHGLEDILASDLAALQENSAAQAVLSAADTFHALLTAYRSHLEPPDTAPLRELIHAIVRGPEKRVARAFAPKFAWNEYESLVLAQGAGRSVVFNIGVEIDPQCSMRVAAFQLVRNALREVGKVLALNPGVASVKDLETVEAAVASERDRLWIMDKCRIPGIVSRVVVEPLFLDPSAVDPYPLSFQHAEKFKPAETWKPAERAAASARAQEKAAGARVAVKPAAAAPLSVSKNPLRVDPERLDAAFGLLAELTATCSEISQTVGEFSRKFSKDGLPGKLGGALARQSRLANELQRALMKMRMVRAEQLFRRFPRIVHDVGKLLGKEVVLQLEGEDTDLDRVLLDALAAPMIHLVRNAVDHGIEPPKERLAAGKSPQGRVVLKASHQGNQIVLEVSDDGCGINRKLVSATALERGLVLPEEIARMTPSAVLNLIFESGFSTAGEITEVSGRGIGLDIVRTVLTHLKGSVSVRTETGKGTTFRLKVPLALAVTRALLFRVGPQVLPCLSATSWRSSGRENLTFVGSRVARPCGCEAKPSRCSVWVNFPALGSLALPRRGARRRTE